VDYFQFSARAGQALVFEIETPRLVPHYFDPRISVLDAQGTELFANVYRRIGGDGDDWVKELEQKTVYTFDHDGKYWLKVTDWTNQRGGRACAYRIMVRPAVPHLGNIAARTVGGGEAEEDRVEIAPGKSRKLDVISELEEGFSGEVAIEVENLPPGVRALPAAAVGESLSSEPGLFYESRGTIHKDRYRPVRLKTTIVLITAKDAPPTPTPRSVRLTARAISGDKAGQAFPFQEIPLMVTSAVHTSPETKTVAGAR
jgi:hypothetical protein